MRDYKPICSLDGPEECALAHSLHSQHLVLVQCEVRGEGLLTLIVANEGKGGRELLNIALLALIRRLLLQDIHSTI